MHPPLASVVGRGWVDELASSLSHAHLWPSSRHPPPPSSVPSPPSHQIPQTIISGNLLQGATTPTPSRYDLADLLIRLSFPTGELLPCLRLWRYYINSIAAKTTHGDLAASRHYSCVVSLLFQDCSSPFLATNEITSRVQGVQAKCVRT
jgi:hypothetical protein